MKCSNRFARNKRAGKPGKKRESALPIKPDLSPSPESHPANRSGGTKGKKVRRLSVTTQEGVIFCALKDIVRIEAAGSYAYIYLLNGQKLIVSRTLSTLEEQLIGFSGFMRVHKSHLVQLGYVEKYQKGDGGTVTLSDGTFIPVSRRAKDELLLRLSRQSC